MKRAETALNVLNETNYPSFCRKAAKKGTLCHGDSGPKNFVLTNQGNYLIDFETLRVELRIYDLFRLIRLTCKREGWGFINARAILDGYQTVSKLASIEYDLLKIWLQFPYKACKLLASYEKAGQKRRRLIEHKLEKSLKNERYISGFLKDFDNYMHRE
ncbi:phosphotransferase [Aneurinibacillus terranovensis]|uniref:phosphotransferase n=1 Tax=Aneurinibacillus terranovensis TaxID=278991 RepID=UPI00041BB646|nr:phosphotransferase [Aneurinibacillus terranovensis]